MEIKSKEQEVTDLKLREALRNLEETTAQEVALVTPLHSEDVT